ncbi:MAG: iron uptake transporter deferrochelatase/peroxidase subunit [Dermatophilaceae bacterium]
MGTETGASGSLNASEGVSRRRLLGASAGAALVGLVGGAYAGRATAADAPAEAAPSSASQLVAFHGAHQAGIVTPAQDRLHFVSLDVRTTDPAALRDLLDRWTEAAARMTRGEETVAGGFDGGASQGPPQDTGEAFGLAASQLTVTIGYGPSLFDGRFGLAARKPAALQELPAFTGDALEPARTGGDLAIQACANDPQVAVHAVRNLIRMGMGLVSVRWSQLGFGRTSSTSTTQATSRNLMGFKDGTNNVKAEDTAALDEHVWVQPADVPGRQAWLAGGCYLVARRIRMHIEVWDRTSLREQEDTFGRTKRTGAAYGQTGEFDTVDFDRERTGGGPLIPATAHIRLASAHQLGGVRILRRGYNYTDGSDGVGHLDAGLFFVAFMRNPATQFVPMQRSLAASDRLNEYIEHTGSAVYACPPGVGPGQGWGAALFG